MFKPTNAGPRLHPTNENLPDHCVEPSTKENLSDQANGPAAALVAATDYTLLVLGGIVVSVFLTSLLLSVIFCRYGQSWARVGTIGQLHVAGKLSPVSLSPTIVSKHHFNFFVF